MADQAITIVEYNPAWPLMFESEKALLEQVLKPWLCGVIEHVGSTSVIGLAAKPVIDIMVGVESLTLSRPAIEILRDHGYCYYPYKSDVMHWFCKPSPEIRTHHLHLVPYESPLWRERILFRSCLRSDPDIAAQYAELKRYLAREHGDDRELYTIKKGPFIKKMLESVQ